MIYLVHLLANENEYSDDLFVMVVSHKDKNINKKTFTDIICLNNLQKRAES